MKVQGTFAVLGLVAALTVGASDAPAAKGQKKGETTHHGTVVSVEKKGEHSILTVKSHSGKKKGQVVAGQAKTHKFEVDGKTKIQTVSTTKAKGKGKTAVKNQRQAGSLASLHHGDHVVIQARRHHADSIAVHHVANAKSKKKAAA
jgi:hypothetical protein